MNPVDLQARGDIKTEARKGRLRDVLLFALFLALFLGLFRGFFFSAKAFYQRDSTLLEIPGRKLAVELLREGGLALWTDAHGNGQPFLANPKNAVLYPGTLVYLLVPFFTAFKIHYLIHVVLAWLGLFALLRAYEISREASFFGATAFLLSGAFLSSFEFYNHVASLAWMPWILLILKRGAGRPSRRLVILSLLWALEILSGTPHLVIMTALLAAGQSLALGDGRGKRLLLAGSSLLLAVFLAAAQLLPAAEALRAADRSEVRGSEWPLEIAQLPEIVFPHVLGDDREAGRDEFWGGHLFDRDYPLYYSFYMGFGVVILAGIGLRKPRDRRHIFWLTAAVFFIILASGDFLPLAYIWKNIPVLSTIRYPVKYMTGAFLSLACLAAFGLDNILRRNKGKAGPWAALGVASLAASVVVAAYPRRTLAPLIRLFLLDNPASILALKESILRGFAVLAATSAVLLTTARRPDRSWAAGSILLILLTGDLAFVNRSINPVVDQGFYSTPSVIAGSGSPVRIFREDSIPPDVRAGAGSSLGLATYFRRSLYPFSGLGDGVEYALNYDFYKLYTSAYEAVKKAFIGRGGPALKKILEESGCRYYIGHQALPGEPGEIIEVGGNPLHVQPLAEAAGPVRIVARTFKASSFEDEIRKFLEEGFHPLEAAVVSGGHEIKGDDLPGDRRDFRIRKDSPSEKRCTVSTSRESLAVFRGNWAPGWKAWVDGREAPVVRANLVSKGVFVPAGRHDIILKYKPLSFSLGILVSAASLLLAGVLFFFSPGPSMASKSGGRLDA